MAQPQRGQSVVEFALVVPLFLFLLFVLVDFSRLLFSYVSLANSTRELVRQASISSSTNASGPIDAFNNFTVLGGGLTPATTVSLQPAGGGIATCSSMTASGCQLNVVGSAAAGTLTLQITPGSANATGAITVILPQSSWNPRSLVASSNTGDYVMISALDRLYDGWIKICPLPLSSSCLLPNRAAASDGVLQADVYYGFVFNPLFQNRLVGVANASFMRPLSMVSTSARTYIE